jgi:exopolyphosphatase/pppGpp-phosphohydrolase
MPEGVPSGLAMGVEALMSVYETEPVHVLHVRDLAVSLFDDLQFLHRMGPLDRAILDAASCLHDIGWTVTQPDGKGHHKESARLIREQCQREGVAFFMKQVGSNAVGTHENGVNLTSLRLKSKSGADPSEWPEDLRIQQFPT